MNYNLTVPYFEIALMFVSYAYIITLEQRLRDIATTTQLVRNLLEREGELVDLVQIHQAHVRAIEAKMFKLAESLVAAKGEIKTLNDNILVLYAASQEAEKEVKSLEERMRSLDLRVRSIEDPWRVTDTNGESWP